MWDEGSVDATLSWMRLNESKPARACVLHVHTQDSDENGVQVYMYG